MTAMSILFSRFLRVTFGVGAVEYARRIKKRCRIVFLRLLTKSKVLSKIYVVFFSDAYDHEVVAVLEGQLGFEKNRVSSDKTNYQLRRAVHCLEKGLIMKKRRGVFALDYIRDAVNGFKSGVQKGGDRDELVWASSVMQEYFRVTDAHPVIDRAERIYLSVPFEISEVEKRKNNSPYTRVLSGSSPVSFESLENLAWRRRSVRWYKEEKVPREKIDKALKVALLSPSACNRQPIQFRIFDTRKSINEIGQLPPGANGFVHNIPVLAVVIGRLRAYPYPKDRHVIYIDAGLAAMSFMFALETQGLSSCAINWPDIPKLEKKLDEKLLLDQDERVVMFISIGFPDEHERVPASKKQSLDQIRVYADS